MASLVLVTTACKDETVEAAAPSSVEPTKIVAPTKLDGLEGDPLAPERVVPPPERKAGSGLAGITRELIDQAKRSESEPLRLIPDAAHFVFRIQPPVLLGHTEIRALWAKAEAGDAEFAGAMDVARACMEQLEAIDEIVLGIDDEENGMMVAHGKGLGTAAMWQCFKDQGASKGHAVDITLTGTARGEGPQLRKGTGKGDDDDGEVGYFPDDDTVVLVSRSWDADVQARLRGAGTPAIEGRLAGVVGRVQREHPLWVAGRISAKVESDLAGSPMAGIDDVAFDLRVEDGDLRFATTVDAGEAADATHMRDTLQEQLSQYKSILPMLGLPSSVGEKLEFLSEGDLVSLGFTLSEAELRGLREFIERM